MVLNCPPHTLHDRSNDDNAADDNADADGTDANADTDADQ
jgi:hypothetical protein